VQRVAFQSGVETLHTDLGLHNESLRSSQRQAKGELEAVGNCPFPVYIHRDEEEQEEQTSMKIKI